MWQTVMANKKRKVVETNEGKLVEKVKNMEKQPDNIEKVEKTNDEDVKKIEEMAKRDAEKIFAKGEL
jgi:hypothetical protein